MGNKREADPDDRFDRSTASFGSNLTPTDAARGKRTVRKKGEGEKRKERGNVTETESRPKIDATFGGKMRITRSAERATVLFLPLCRPNASFLLFCLKFASIFSFSIIGKRNEGKGNTPVPEWSRVRVNQPDRELKRCANTIDGSV